MVTTPAWKQAENLEDDFSAFNQRAVNNLRKIISETNATIVLTTSHKSRFTLNQWSAIFKKRGIHVNALSRLKENTDLLTRKEEILHWYNQGVDGSFVIIDDDKSLNDLPAYLKEKCVLTNYLIGLNDETASQALSILTHQPATA